MSVQTAEGAGLSINVNVVVPLTMLQNLVVNYIDMGGQVGGWIVRYEKAKDKEITAADIKAAIDALPIEEDMKEKGYERYSYPFIPGCALVFVTEDEAVAGKGKKYRLDWEAVQRGTQALAHSEKHKHHFHNMLEENDDIITADIWIQYCLFGEEIYS